MRDFIIKPLTEATQSFLDDAPNIELTDRLHVWLDQKGEQFMMRAWRDDGWSASWGARTFFRDLPERRPVGPREPDEWYVAATDLNAILIAHHWPSDQILWGKDGTGHAECELLYRTLLARFDVQSLRANQQAKYKLTGEVPEVDCRYHPERPLSEYQQAALGFAICQEGTALFMDRGTGKTAVCVQRICTEAKLKKDMYRALIVVPPQVRLNWSQEFEAFATTAGKVTIIKGMKHQRVKLLTRAVTSEEDCEWSAAIISYDSLVNSMEALMMIPWDLIVCDESHFFKSSSTKRWKALKELRARAKYRMVLTGTPIGNSPMDLWSQLEFLGDGLSGFRQFSAFRKFYGSWETVPGSPGIQKLIGLKNMPLLQERLARLAFSITKEEAGLNLPDKVYDVYEVSMTKKQRDIYDDMRDGLRIEIENVLSGNVDMMTVEHILTQLMRLAQITSGFVTFDAKYDLDIGTETEAKRVEQIDWPNSKIEGIVDMLTAEDRDPKGKTIIWCCFRQDIQALASRLRELGIVYGTYYGSTKQNDRDELVRRFNCDPEFKVLICNPQTAGEGLNLLGYDKNDEENSDTYCDHEIFMSQNWSAIGRAQAEDRAHRRGTRMPVRITDVVVPDTIDEEIRRRVKSKQQSAMTVLEIRELLKEVL